MSKVFVTADLHFQHKNILMHQANREFDSIEEMDEFIIQEWNKQVTDKDTVYILGDVSFRGKPEITAQYLNRMNGQIKIVPGNHDHDIRKTYALAKAQNILAKKRDNLFEILAPIHELKYNGKKFVFCHFPIENWHGAIREFYDQNHNEGRKSTIHLHGHNHGKGTKVMYRLDVGWDATGNVVTDLNDIINAIQDNGFIEL